MTEPLRVLHVDAEPGYRGGQRQLRLLIGEQLRDPGLLVGAMVRSDRLRQELVALGLPCRPWPGGVRGLYLLRAALADRDLVHAHDARSQGYARAAGWPRAGRRLVVHRRIDDVPHDRATTRWKYAEGSMICVSHAVAGGLAAWGVPADRLRVQWSAAPLVVSPPSPPAPSGDGLRLACVGALVAHKGHGDLLEALACSHRPHTLQIAGDGPLRRELLDRIQRLGLVERVQLLGEQGDAHAVLSAADACVQPSRSEGLGTAVLDALARGRPVIATSVGGLPEIVGADTGFLVPPRDPEAMAAALDRLARLASQDAAAFSALGLRGRARVAAHHRPEHLSAGVRAVYDEGG